MKSLAPCALVIAAALGSTTGAGVARAQTPPAEAPANAAPPDAPYQDRVLEGLPPEEDPTPPYDAHGWRRFLRWDLSLGSSRFQRDAQARWGTGFYGQLETPNLGSLSAEGQANLDGYGGHFTLHQRAMPLDGGWFANHELGVITSPSPGMLRLPARVYLPTPLLRGFSGEWLRGDGALAWQLSSGQPGLLGVFPDTGFLPRPGQRTRAAAQWGAVGEKDGGWSLAAQHEIARGVRADGSSENGLIDADASLLALRHAGPELRWQAQWMGSREPGQNRQGLWFDTEWDETETPRQWGAGLYRLDPGLRWAGLAMSSDLEGAYLRSSWRQRRWSLDGSLDVLRARETRRDWGYYGTLGARWRLSRDSSFGVGGAWRQLGSGAGSLYADWRFANAQGPAGLRLSHSTGLGQPPSTELSYDQEWRLPDRWTLATSLGLVAEAADARNALPADTALKTGISLSGELSRSAGLRLQYNGEDGRSGRATHSLALSAHWQFQPRWSLEASFNRNSGRQRQPDSLDPLQVFEPLNALSDRSFLLMLRYQFEAGSRHIPLGGRAGAGGGSVQGVVFYDANRNGLQEASEAGVPNATVYLDNRYAMRTDSQGRFEFPSVAPGPRTLTLRNDTLPLPWAVVDKGIARVDVQLRDSAQVLLPVQRPD